jgi:AbiTii
MSDIRKSIKTIQLDIVTAESNLHSILLKTKVLAYQLKNEDLKKWVKSEIDGYSKRSDIPDYRIIRSAPIKGTFFNGFYKYSNRDVGITTVPESLQEKSEDLYIYDSTITLEEMAKKDQLWSHFPHEWVQLYNIHNAENLNGGYQLLEAYQPILGIWATHILGVIRSRLQDFILEIDSLDWDVDREDPTSDKVREIFQITINNQVQGLNMSSSQENGDTYNVIQAGAVGKYASSNGNTFNQSEQNQSLSEAVKEIQQLLEVLEKTNPVATEGDKIAYLNDETTPSFKRRAVSAFLSGSETAIDEFILENKSLKVVKAAIRGWVKPE